MSLLQPAWLFSGAGPSDALTAISVATSTASIVAVSTAVIDLEKAEIAAVSL